MIAWLRAAFAAMLLILAAPLAAQTHDPAGLWAVQADGQILALLDLRRDLDAPGGWNGYWIRPERFTVSQAHSAFDISGPVVRRAIRRAVAHGDVIDLDIEGSSPSAEPSLFIFRVVGENHAELGWRDPLAIPPIAMVRADPGATVAPFWTPGDHPLTTPRPSNSEMRAIFAADQADRQAGPAIDWAAVTPRDAVRRTRTRALLDAGALRSGTDFFHAAFVFQHGDEADDHLLAHALALVAVARGRPDAAWIAAATLDRYLQNIDRPQIFGTQFSFRPGEPVTQEPYNRALVPDALRRALGVPALAEQEARRGEVEAGRSSQ